MRWEQKVFTRPEQILDVCIKSCLLWQRICRIHFSQDSWQLVTLLIKIANSNDSVPELSLTHPTLSLNEVEINFYDSIPSTGKTYSSPRGKKNAVPMQETRYQWSVCGSMINYEDCWFSVQLAFLFIIVLGQITKHVWRNERTRKLLEMLFKVWDHVLWI